MQTISKIILSVLSLFFLSSSAIAEQSLTSDQLVEMLQEKKPVQKGPRTLSIEELELLQFNKANIERVKSGQNLTVGDRQLLTHFVKQKKSPTVDLEVYFEYNSAVITPQATKVLITLGKALEDQKLTGSTFMVAGHTDAKGSADYNQKLSQKRAKAVKTFLSSNFEINPKSLISVGYGEEELKITGNPEAAGNRRVQIVNLGTEVANK
ncbi:OmpA family protein [Hyphomicrobiales bacterium 4NK60-0047b]